MPIKYTNASATRPGHPPEKNVERVKKMMGDMKNTLPT
jgi:hypothetical protein